MHAPYAPQVHAAVHVRVFCSPSAQPLVEVSVVPTAHSPSLQNPELQEHDDEHVSVRTPQREPHGALRVCFGVQTPLSPPQSDHAVHMPSLPHMRTRVPHLPHAARSLSPGVAHVVGPVSVGSGSLVSPGSALSRGGGGAVSSSMGPVSEGSAPSK
jgi:hypothetical protein